MAGKGHQLACSETSTPNLCTSLNFSSTTLVSCSTFLLSVSMVSSANLQRRLAAMYLGLKVQYSRPYSASLNHPHIIAYTKQRLREIFGRLTDEQMYKKNRGTHFSFAAVMRSILCRTSCSAAANLLCNAPSSCSSSYTVWSTASSLCKAPCSLLAVTCRGEKWKRKVGKEGN